MPFLSPKFKDFAGEPDVPVRVLIPNAITTLALCSGLASIHFSMQDKPEPAMGAIVLAGIFDVLDGRAARILKASSRFGAILDSLSDFLCFGVAPAVLLYKVPSLNVDAFGLAAATTYVLCAAMRLARFTSVAYSSTKPDAQVSAFFTGMPSPAAAGVVMIPALLDASGVLTKVGITIHPTLVALHMFVIGLLMISRLPMFSIKKLRIPRGLIAPLFIVLGLVVVAAVNNLWLTLAVLAALYLALLPVAVLVHRKERIGIAKARRASSPELQDPATSIQSGIQ